MKINFPVRFLLTFLVSILTAAIALPLAAQTTQSLSVVSGNGSLQSTDSLIQYSLDSGTTWTTGACIVPFLSGAYAPPIDGSNYVNWSCSFQTSGPFNAWVTYRIPFTLPVEFWDPGFTIQVHADNVAKITLNGCDLGMQPFAEIPSNFQDPPEQFSTAQASCFLSGTNYLYVDVFNFSGPTAVDFKATVGVTVATPVQIDIKPGSYPNSIGCSSRGVIPVAILSTQEFDATTVDPLTVELNGVKAKVVGKKGQSMCSLEDVDGDGDTDMVCQIPTIDFLMDSCDISDTAILRAQTFAGVHITGEDTVRIVPDTQ